MIVLGIQTRLPFVSLILPAAMDDSRNFLFYVSWALWSVMRSMVSWDAHAAYSELYSKSTGLTNS